LDAVHTYLPHAPKHGLYLAPDIPPAKLRGALGDFAGGVAAEDVLALYDGTLLGSAKDGVVFLHDRLIVQNTDLETPRTIRYGDVVGVQQKRAVLGGRRVEVDVNRGRATTTERLDFTAHGEAAEYVERLLNQMLLEPPAPSPAEAGGTDQTAVIAALDRLVREGRLRDDDRRRMLDALAG